MNSVSIVSKRINRIMSVSLAYHGKKTEFLNSFVLLTLKRIMRIMFWRVRLSVCLKERKERNKEKKEVKSFLLLLAERKKQAQSGALQTQAQGKGMVGILTSMRLGNGKTVIECRGDG